MSNFICPTCGITNIDCGKEGYKTPREIELEKKLDIAVKALKSAFGMAKGGKSTLLQTPENSVLANIEIDCAIALKEIEGCEKSTD